MWTRGDVSDAGAVHPADPGGDVDLFIEGQMGDLVRCVSGCGMDVGRYGRDDGLYHGRLPRRGQSRVRWWDRGWEGEGIRGLPVGRREEAGRERG